VGIVEEGTMPREDRREASRKKVRSERQKRQHKFLRALRECGTIWHAARRVHISRVTVHYWVRHDPKFRQLMLDAKQSAIERLETSAYKRALKGDTLLTIFLLKAYRPETYRDRYEGKIDEGELNQAIERELARLAPRGEAEIPRIIEGTARDLTGESPPKAGGVS
jgi:hypothetical protein